MNQSVLVKALLALTLLGVSGLSRADNAAHSTESVPDVAYAKPGQRVAIPSSNPSELRHLNLRCSGNGPITVLLEAGSRADSVTWFRVQPILAKKARVCSYDRAGYGFSDEGPLPRDVDADVRDLDALINAADIRTPLVLAGHSLGTDIVRRYAELHRERVAGLVLVDPPDYYIADFAPDWAASERASTQQRGVLIHTCLDAATAGTLAKGEGDSARCIAAPDPTWPEAVRSSIRAYKLKPGFWRTINSELSCNDTVFSAPIVVNSIKSDLPVWIMVAADTYAEAPPPLRMAFEQSREKTINAIAANTTRSHRIDVANSGHDVQLDQPLAVADAVNGLLKQLAGESGEKH